MSEYAHIIERSRRAFAAVSSAEAFIEREPDNAAAHTNLKGLRRIALSTQSELEKFAARQRIDICHYRLVPEEAGNYLVGNVSSCLLSYQNLFSQIYDALRNGPKQKAHIGKQAEAESALNFAYTYSGSLGVTLLANNDRGFFEGELDKAINTLYEIMGIETADSVAGIAKDLGRAVVKRVHDWSKANVEGGFSSDIKWKRSDGRLLGQMVDQQRLKRISDFIEASSDTQTRVVAVTGMLVGGDIEKKTFHLSVPDGESFKGSLSDEATLSSQALGHIYNARIEISETYFYATEATKVTTRLLSLTRL